MRPLPHGVGTLFFPVAALLALGCSGSGSGAGTRADSRAVISGQVVLAPLMGASDMSRVRVDLGRGEGGVAVEPDGSFAFSDLEPDVYVLTVTYAGGLTDMASGSAYQPLSLRVVTRAGSAVSVGQVAPQLGSAPVSGTVTHAAGGDLSGLQVRLLGTDSVKEVLSTDGTFSFPSVPVGRYRLQVSRADLAGVCGTEVVVPAHDAPVTLAPQAVASLRAEPGPANAAMLFGAPQGGRWFLTGNAVTVQVAVPSGAQARAWLLSGSAPAFGTTGAFEFTGLAADAEHAVAVEVRDSCGTVARQDVTLVVDRTAPSAFFTVVAPTGYLRDPTVLFTTDGADTLGEPLEVRVRQCEGDGAAASCTPAALADAPWQPLLPVLTVTTADQDGPKRVELQVRDRSHNETTVHTETFTLDRTAPVVTSVDVEGATNGTVFTRTPTISVSATDAAGNPADLQIRFGLSATLDSAAWRPFVSGVPLQGVDLGTESGTATFHVQLRDGAQNLSAVVPTALTVSNLGSLVGQVHLRSSPNASGASVLLLGTQFSATTDALGNFTITSVPRGRYDVEVRASGYRTTTLLGTEIVPPDATDLRRVALEPATGEIAGKVTLDGKGMNNHGGAEVTLTLPDMSTRTAVSDSGGFFAFPVEPGTYNGPIRATVQNHLPAEYTGGTVVVQDDQTVNLGELFLVAVANNLSGTVDVEDATDDSGVAVAVTGMPGTSTDGQQLAAVTGSNGFFRILGLPLGNYSVTFSKPGDPQLESASRLVTIRKGDETTLPEVIPLRRRFVTIANGADFTRTNMVSLTLSRAPDCEQMEISNDPAFPAGAATVRVACAATLPNWSLGSTQGTVRVYARFYSVGSSTPGPTVSDSIVYDNTATITAFTATPTSSLAVPLLVGSVVHFRATTGTESQGGTMTVGIAGYAQGIQLYDDGTHGDVTANNNVYELDYRLELPTDISNAVMRADFVDAAGNTANRNATGNLFLKVPPVIFGIRVEVNSQDNRVTLSWQTDEDTTGVVDNGGMPSATTLGTSTTLAQSHTVSFTVSGAPGTEFTYRITATDRLGYAATTANRTFTLQPSKPTFPAAMSGLTKVWFRWEGPNQRNLSGYNIYRATAPDGPYTRISGSMPYTHEVNLFEDANVVAGQTYWYQAETVDGTGNLSERSDARSATPGPSTGPTTIAGPTALLRRGTAENPEGVYTWDERGSPYIIDSDVLVEGDALLVVGPNTRVIFNEPTGTSDRHNVEVQGRFAALGMRGTVTMVNGEPVESSDGMVEFASALPAPLSNTNHWRGIRFTVNPEKLPPNGALDMESFRGTYLSGNVVFRTRLRHGGHSAPSDYQGIVSDVFTGTEQTFQASLYFARSSVESARCSISSRARHIVVRDSTFTQSECAAVAAEGVRVLLERNTARDASAGFQVQGIRPSFVPGLPGLVPSTDRWQHSDCLVRQSLVENMTSFGFQLGSTCVGVDLTARNIRSSDNQGGTAITGGGVVARSLLENNRRHAESVTVSGVTARRATGVAFDAVALYGSEVDDTGCDSMCPASVHDVRTTREVLANRFLATNRNDRSSSVRVLGTAVVRHNHFLMPLAYTGGVFSLGSSDVSSVVQGNSLLGTVAPGAALAVVAGPLYSATQRVDARFNHWGALATAEMQGLPPASNISFIVDQQDMPGSNGPREVDYSGFVNHAYPLPSISQPHWKQKFYAGENVVLTGSATDPDETLLPASFVWVTDTGTVLGTGTSLTLTTPPVALDRKVWLEVTDSGGLKARVPVVFDVYPAP